VSSSTGRNLAKMQSTITWPISRSILDESPGQQLTFDFYRIMKESAVVKMASMKKDSTTIRTEKTGLDRKEFTATKVHSPSKIDSRGIRCVPPGLKTRPQYLPNRNRQQDDDDPNHEHGDAHPPDHVQTFVRCICNKRNNDYNQRWCNLGDEVWHL
jgi:hypothetical protein